MQRKLTGAPPLTFVSNGENLADYRIYGNSGGVGDRTENLFDVANQIEYYYLNPDGTITYSDSHATHTSDYIDVTNINILTLTGIRRTPPISENSRRCIFFNDAMRIVSEGGINWDISSPNYIYVPNNAKYFRFSYDVAFENVMLYSGNNAIPYEPYGYKIPVVCGGTTTNIYLDKPLRENESISMSDTGVSIPTINGSNTLSVNTTVQPSSVYVKYATNERSVPARTYLQGVEEMDNWAIYNYINREGSGALRNESTVTSTTVEVRKTIKFTGAALGGTAPYQYAFYFKRGNAAEWTTKSDYGVATTVDFTPYYVDTYKYKVNAKDSKGTIKSKIFNINVTAAASTTSNMPSLDKLSFDDTNELTVDNDFNRAELTVEDNTSEEV